MNPNKRKGIPVAKQHNSSIENKRKKQQKDCKGIKNTVHKIATTLYIFSERTFPAVEMDLDPSPEPATSAPPEAPPSLSSTLSESESLF
jgi:hypothetical protein